MPQLRTAIADYLNRVRGTVARPDQVVICTGYAQGIAEGVDVLARVIGGLAPGLAAGGGR